MEAEVAYDGTAPDRLRGASAGGIQVWTRTSGVLCQLYRGPSNSATVSVLFDLQKSAIQHLTLFVGYSII
jgi:hypothetical protein